VLAGMLRVLVIGLVVLVAAMFLIPRGERGALQAATLLPQARTLPDVALVDSQKQPLRLKDLEGQYTLLFFGFTNCPDVCPLTLKALADTRSELARRAPRVLPPRVLFVSVDPQRDDVEHIASYVARFDASFIGARAPDRVLEPLLAALGVAVEKHAHGDAQYNVMHGSDVYILNPKAEWIAVAKGPHDPAVFATDYLKIRQRRPAA
jgi:protein SCO1/2